MSIHRCPGHKRPGWKRPSQKRPAYPRHRYKCPGHKRLGHKRLGQICPCTNVLKRQGYKHPRSAYKCLGHKRPGDKHPDYNVLVKHYYDLFGAPLMELATEDMLMMDPPSLI